MPDAIEPLIVEIHAAPGQLVLALSGGGSGALADLLRVPGASRTVLEAVVPYSKEALVSWLGGRPDQFCSARTARAMAMVAFRRGLGYAAGQSPVAGVACTASLASDHPKLGPHRAHVALQTASTTAFWSLELRKEARNRVEEENLVDRIVLSAVADGCGLDRRLGLDLLEGESIEPSRTTAPQSWQQLLLGQCELVLQGTAVPRAGSDAPRAIFPGEFNPIHLGHRRMAEIAQRVLGLPVEFEISITNVDKPPLDYCEIQRRTVQFDSRQAVWLSRAARFTEKSRLFPGATFIVGIDTLRRIASPHYYGDDAAACAAAISLIAARGCRFLVFGRNLGTGFISLGDLDLPDPLPAICDEIPATEFREDISSTGLRRAQRR